MSKPVILLDAGQFVGLFGTTDGDVLAWDATEGAWKAAPGGGVGTVTSVALSTASTGLTVSGGTSQTITGAGTFTLGGTLGAGYGGTGLGAPVSGDAGKVLTATSGGGYELATPAPSGVTSITAGAGLSGGTITSTGTISMPNVGTADTYGSASAVAVFTTDDQGRVSSATTTAIAGLDAGVITTGQLGLARGGTGADLSGITEGEILVGQSGGGSLDAVSVFGDATLSALGAVTVTGIQGRPVSSVAPTSGQSLVWSTSGSGGWVPGDVASGGSGGGGVVYFMNAGTTVTGGNLPADTYQLGRTAEVASHPITYSSVPASAWTRIAGFVSDSSDPNIGTMPAGIWDFNVYATSTAAANAMTFRLTLYSYDSSTNPESGAQLAQTLATAIYDPSVATQYQATFNIGPLSFTGKRIYLKLEAFTASNSKDVTFDFGDSYASHVHTTVPSVTGSGFVKVLNDVIVSSGQTIDLAAGTDVGSSVLGVTNGGTGAASLTQHAVLLGNGTSTVAAVSLAAGDVLLGTGGAPAATSLATIAVTALTGTSNQVDVSASVGAVTLSLPQSINSGASPTFAGLTLSGLSDGLVRSTSGVLAGGATVVGSDFGSQSANRVFAAPNGSAGNPSFRALVAADIPSLDAGKITSGYFVPQQGGTGITAYTTGDLLYASDTFTLSRLADVGTGNALVSGGVGAAPSYGKIGLTTHITGTLAVGNGGTGATTLTGYVKGNGTSAMTAAAAIPVADVTGAAPLASPAFTGTPSLPTGTTGVTQSANNNSTALATTAYADTAASNAKGAPYDVACEYVGKPPVSTVLMRFVANRSWTLKRTLVQAACTAFPTGSNAVATISVAGSNIASGTITWTTGSLITVGAFADTTITSGQAVVFTLTTADSGNTFENPFFTLGGVVA